MSDFIVLDHGSGGRKSRDLVLEVFQSRFTDPALLAGTDAAVVEGAGQIAITTDAHVVNPLFFPGGDIGKLAVCGTVNDLVVSGAVPRYLSASFIIEEGFELAKLVDIVESMKMSATESAVSIVAGDTKVVEKGACDGLFISTTGVGAVPPERAGIAGGIKVEAGDKVIVTGSVGDHGATIACVRNGITTDPPLLSDCAPLAGIAESIYRAGVIPHFMRDATRGGLGTVLCELSEMRSVTVEVDEESIPVRDQVRGVCEMYGFDPLYLANEGAMVCVVASGDAAPALDAITGHERGQKAAVVGEIREPGAVRPGAVRPGAGRVVLNTGIGGRRIIRMLSGEQLPRIC